MTKMTHCDISQNIVLYQNRAKFNFKPQTSLKRPNVALLQYFRQYIDCVTEAKNLNLKKNNIKHFYRVQIEELDEVFLKRFEWDGVQMIL